MEGAVGLDNVGECQYSGEMDGSVWSASQNLGALAATSTGSYFGESG